MRMAPFLRFVLRALVLVLLVGSPNSASAQAGAAGPGAQKRDPEAKARAQKHFDRGVAAFKEGRYKDAVDAFLDAHREYPSPALSFNAARAYDKLLDAAGALRFYREYLRQSTDAPDRADVEKRVGELETKLQQERGRQQVTILSNVEGATVRIDDQPVGVAPWTGEILPGKHRVRLSFEGHEDAEQEFELLAHRATDVSVTMTPKRAAETPTAAAPPAGAPKSKGAVESRGVGVWTYAAFGVGVAALGGAGVFEVLRSGSEDDVKNERTQLARHDAYDRMQSQQKTARILAGVGAVAMVAGGVLLYFDLSAGKSKEGSAKVGVTCGPGQCGAALRGVF